MVALSWGSARIGDASRGGIGILGTSKVGYGKPEGASEFWICRKPNNVSKVGATFFMLKHILVEVNHNKHWYIHH